MCSPSPPPPPDYAGAANAQGAANVETAIANTILNRPNEVTPYGTRTWTPTGSTQVGNYSVPNYQSNINFTDLGKKLFDAGNNISLGLADSGQKALSGVQASVANPLDLSSLPQGRDAITDAMYQRYTRLLDPQYAQLQRSTETNLINKGFSVGDEAYTKEMNNFERNRENAYADARNQAITSGSGIAQNERNQAINEILLKRQQPLAELSSLRTGAAPQQPTFQPFAANANAQPAPVFAGAQAAGQYGTDVYNQQAASNSGMLGGLFKLGAAALPLMFGVPA